MTPELIFRAARHDMQSGREQPSCGSMPTWINLKDPLSDTQYASGYAEPGYDSPKCGILFANWNQYPRRLTEILERAGYAIEWSDEWATCDGCQRAVRTSPDSYSWRRSYWVDEKNSEILCADCTRDNPDDYETHLLNNPHHADTFDVDWQARGFTKLNADHFENGFHPGQNDDPKKIAKTVPTDHDYLFAIPSVGQFDVSFDCWIKPLETE